MATPQEDKKQEVEDELYSPLDAITHVAMENPTELLDEAEYKQINRIFKQRFGDPGNFTFYFVGIFNTIY